MTKKGFTMIELLGVIVVLGLLATIIYPVVNNSINRSKEDLYNVQISSIKSGARSWGADHMADLPKEEGTTIKVMLTELQENGYVDEDLQNPKTKEVFDGSIYVTITMKNKVLEYEVGGLS
ncbi:MAG: prepilin-type N-terminal cleavage/methylation domain-containing protein [Bacilli bacterium]|nr:prepilin-type N-terminal cleavage/methylation domain-containing protein [Bacilli bacterium]